MVVEATRLYDEDPEDILDGLRVLRRDEGSLESLVAQAFSFISYPPIAWLTFAQLQAWRTEHAVTAAHEHPVEDVATHTLYGIGIELAGRLVHLLIEDITGEFED